MPLVSIIMPAYNAAATIRESIESVVNQTYKDWELIVVVDGATDATRDIANEYAKFDSRIKILNLCESTGPSNARNIGASEANGTWLAFLDSDDLWLPRKLEEQVAYHTAHRSCSVSHTDFWIVANGKILRRPWGKLLSPYKHRRGKLLPHLYWKNVIGTLTVMVKREVFQRAGGFDVSLWGTEDHDLWIRLAEDENEFGFISDRLALYRLTLNGVSSAMGKYKSGMKRQISKDVLNNPNVDKYGKKKALGYYYRHFGTAYFKRGEYRIANLYFEESLTYHRVSVISFTTVIYMLLVLLRRFRLWLGKFAA